MKLNTAVVVGLFLAVVSTQAALLAAEPSTVLVGALENGSVLEVSRPLTIALDYGYGDYDGASEGYGAAAFQKGKLLSNRGLDEALPGCELQATLARPSLHREVPRELTLKAGQMLTVSSMKLSSTRDAKEVSLTFDFETMVDPQYTLLCRFPGKQYQSVTSADFGTILGTYLRLK